MRWRKRDRTDGVLGRIGRGRRRDSGEEAQQIARDEAAVRARLQYVRSRFGPQPLEDAENDRWVDESPGLDDPSLGVRQPGARSEHRFEPEQAPGGSARPSTHAEWLPEAFANDAAAPIHDSPEPDRADPPDSFEPEQYVPLTEHPPVLSEPPAANHRDSEPAWTDEPAPPLGGISAEALHEDDLSPPAQLRPWGGPQARWVAIAEGALHSAGSWAAAQPEVVAQPMSGLATSAPVEGRDPVFEEQPRPAPAPHDPEAWQPPLDESQPPPDELAEEKPTPSDTPMPAETPTHWLHVGASPVQRAGPDPQRPEAARRWLPDGFDNGQTAAPSAPEDDTPAGPALTSASDWLPEGLQRDAGAFRE
jgi:hypothetical protein